MTKRFRSALGAAVCLVLAGGAAAQAQDGSDNATPADQVYRVSFEPVAPTYGGEIYFSFSDWTIDSYTDGGIGGADQPGGTGSWDANGAGVSIFGDPVEPDDPGDEMPPAPALQLLAEGQTRADCDHWPQIEVGASADPSSLCWITNPHVLSVTRTQ